MKKYVSHFAGQRWTMAACCFLVGLGLMFMAHGLDIGIWLFAFGIGPLAGNVILALWLVLVDLYRFIVKPRAKLPTERGYVEYLVKVHETLCGYDVCICFANCFVFNTEFGYHHDSHEVYYDRLKKVVKDEIDKRRANGLDLYEMSDHYHRMVASKNGGYLWPLDYEGLEMRRQFIRVLAAEANGGKAVKELYRYPSNYVERP